MSDDKNNPSNDNSGTSNVSPSLPSNTTPYDQFLSDIDSPPMANMRPIWEGFTYNGNSKESE